MRAKSKLNTLTTNWLAAYSFGWTGRIATAVPISSVKNVVRDSAVPCAAGDACLVLPASVKQSQRRKRSQK